MRHVLSYYPQIARFTRRSFTSPFAPLLWRSQVVPARIAHGTNSSDLSSYAFGESASPTANRLLLLAVTCVHASAAEVPNSISAYGVTWNRPGGVASGTGTFAAGNRRTTWFYGWGTNPTTGAVTVGFATAHLSCQYAMIEVAGAALVAPRQSTTATAVGTTVTGTLSTFEYLNNLHIYALGRVTAEATAVPAVGGWAGLSDLTMTAPIGAQSVGFTLGDLTADPTWVTSGGSAIVDLEIQAAR